MARIPPALKKLGVALGAEALRQLRQRASEAKRNKPAKQSKPKSQSKGSAGGRSSIPKPPSGGRTIPRPPASAPKKTGARHGSDARRDVTDTALARPQVAYAPAHDGDADPGEIVWTWVPYEEDASKGKDRPVLVIGSWGDDVAALALTTKQHWDRHHHAVGIWDGEDGRQSWLKLDRLLRLDPDGIRREGAVLPEDRFRDAIKAWERY